MIFPKLVPIDRRKLSICRSKSASSSPHKRGIGTRFARAARLSADGRFAARRLEGDGAHAAFDCPRIFRRRRQARDDHFRHAHSPVGKRQNEISCAKESKPNKKANGFRPSRNDLKRASARRLRLLAHFTEEQAEIRLIIDDEIGEFGIGKEHLNDALKRLALIEPNFVENGETEFSAETVEEIFTGRENSYTFFVTAIKEDKLPLEIQQRAKVLRF